MIMSWFLYIIAAIIAFPFVIKMLYEITDRSKTVFDMFDLAIACILSFFWSFSLPILGILILINKGHFTNWKIDFSNFLIKEDDEQ